MAKMTLALAEECIRKAKEKATEMKAAMFIAIVDEMGKLVAFARMEIQELGSARRFRWPRRKRL